MDYSRTGVGLSKTNPMNTTHHVQRSEKFLSNPQPVLVSKLLDNSTKPASHCFPAPQKQSEMVECNKQSQLSAVTTIHISNYMVLEPNTPLFMYIQVIGNVHRPSCVISGQYPGSKSQITGLGQSMPD